VHSLDSDACCLCVQDVLRVAKEAGTKTLRLANPMGKRKAPETQGHGTEQANVGESSQKCANGFLSMVRQHATTKTRHQVAHVTPDLTESCLETRTPFTDS